MKSCICLLLAVVALDSVGCADKLSLKNRTLINRNRLKNERLRLIVLADSLAEKHEEAIKSPFRKVLLARGYDLLELQSGDPEANPVELGRQKDASLLNVVKVSVSNIYNPKVRMLAQIIEVESGKVVFESEGNQGVFEGPSVNKLITELAENTAQQVP